MAVAMKGWPVGVDEGGGGLLRRAGDKPIRSYYSWEEWKRILINWPRWRAMLYVERQKFEEGGRIDRRERRTEAPFVRLVLTYFDLELAILRTRLYLGARAEDVFRAYWKDQLINDDIAAKLGMSNSTVTALLWSFTADVAERMVWRPKDKDEPSVSELVREWKEGRKGKAREFV